MCMEPNVLRLILLISGRFEYCFEVRRSSNRDLELTTIRTVWLCPPKLSPAHLAVGLRLVCRQPIKHG